MEAERDYIQNTLRRMIQRTKWRIHPSWIMPEKQVRKYSLDRTKSNKLTMLRHHMIHRIWTEGGILRSLWVDIVSIEFISCSPLADQLKHFLLKVYFKSWDGTVNGVPPTGGGGAGGMLWSSTTCPSNYGSGFVKNVVIKNFVLDQVDTPVALHQTNGGHS